MNPLVVIFTHSQANDIVRRHWPWYQKSECELLGITTQDGDCYWPGKDSIKIGLENGPLGTNYLFRFLDAIHHVRDAEWYNYTDTFCFVEADSIFLKPPIPLRPYHLMTRLNGYRSEGFCGSRFCHSPWYMDRSMINQIAEYGARMIACELTEKGFLDRWLGLMFDLYQLQWFDCSASTYSQNTIDKPHMIQEAREAIARGAWYVHGIKTAEQLKAITE